MTTNEARQRFEEATTRGKEIWANHRKTEKEKKKTRRKKKAEDEVVVVDPDSDEWKRTYKGEA